MMLLKKDDGVALVIVLLTLTTLTIAGKTAIKSTVIDMEISGNVKEIKQAFYISEAGIFTK